MHGGIFGVGLIHRWIAAEGVRIEPGGNRQGRPQVREDAAPDELPRRGPEREPEPWARDHRAGDRVARLGLEVPQAYEPAEGDPEQHLGALGADADDAPERLQVPQQLAEA